MAPEPPECRTVLALPRDRILVALLAAVALLDLAFAATHFLKLQGYDGQLGLRRMFHMAGEGTLPAWFTSALMLVCASLLAVIAAWATRLGDRFRRHWWGLSLGFLWMSADEAAEIHELLNRPGHALPFEAQGLINAPWVVFGVAIAAAVGFAYLRFLAALPRETRWRFVVAGACFVAGALGVEMLGAWFADAQGLAGQPPGWERAGEFSTGYMLFVLVEESLEMIGVILFIDALLGHIDQRLSRVTFEASRRSA